MRDDTLAIIIGFFLILCILICVFFVGMGGCGGGCPPRRQDLPGTNTRRPKARDGCGMKREFKERHNASESYYEIGERKRNEYYGI